MPDSLTRPLRRLAACGVMACAFAASARGQQDNPVYVDDSPQARELLRQAKDQTRENAGEAVRLYQELLTEFALKLVPASEVAGDQFTSVRQRVLAALLNDRDLLDRYRLVQTPPAEQLLQVGDLSKVATAYALTEPGLEAMLRLAQRELESGRFHASLTWLGQAQAHPDFFGRRAAHGLYMSALAWHDLGSSDNAAAMRNALLALGADGEAFDRELETLFAAPSPQIARDIGMLERGPEPALSDVVPQPIWSVPLEDSLFQRRVRALTDNEEAIGVGINNGNNGGNRINNRNDQRQDSRLRDADLATATVTVVGPVAYINEGHTILALDRLTGREIWSYQDLSRLGMTEQGGSLDAMDLSMIAVEGDALVTLTGHAQANRRSDSGRVICINVADGERRWSAPLTGIVDTAADEELFPHGAPVIVEGRVYVMARKVSSQLLTGAYVVALDINDGSVIWSRFLASSGGLRIAARPFDSLIERDGSVFVASAVGATARIDCATGEIRWLRRFNVPINSPISDQSRRPWEMATPVVTSRGVVAIQPDTRRVILLDLETGDELASHSAGTTGDWNSPRYLISDGDHVISVGSDIRGFNIDALDAPVWRVPALMVQQSPDDPPPMDAIEMRGRVQLAGDKLIAPTAEGVLVIDAITGFIEQTLSIDASGNPLAYESQMLLAGSDRLDAYMSMRRAEEMLRQQMAASPDAPEPALSLLRLGIRAGNVPLALEAADRAMAAAQAHADDPAFDERRFGGRAELFALLLDLARSNKNLSTEQGEGVFARLQQAAFGPEQRVEHLLAYGDWLAPKALPRAVETWQTVLSDERLAPVWLNEEGIARQARARALERIGRVIASRGASAYAPQADFAALRLMQIRETVPPDIDQLLALAAEFAHAPAAIDAALQVADIRAARGDVSGALAALTQTYVAAPSKSSATRLFGRFADIAMKDGRDDQARQALIAVRSAFGDAELESASGTARLSRRLTELNDPSMRLPTIGSLSGEPSLVGAPVIMPARTFVGTLPHDRFLVCDGNTVKLISSQKIEPIWEALVEGSSPQILRFDAQSIVLWLGTDPEHPRAVCLNAADGAMLWTTPRLSESIPGWGASSAIPGERVRVSREQMPNGDSYDPTETIAIASDNAILMVHRGGQIASISTIDGKTVQWSKPAALQQVHLAVVRNGALVLAGMARDIDAGRGDAEATRDRRTADAQQSPSMLLPRIVVLDPETGRPMFGDDGLVMPSGRGGIKWMTVSPLGVLVYGTTEGIEAANLAGGERAWTTTAYGTADSQRAWGMPQRVVFEDVRSRLRSIRIDDGVVSDSFELPLRGEWDPLELRDLIVSGETLIARYGQRIVIFDAETGRVTGADAVAEDRDFRWLIETQDRLHAVSFSSSQRASNAVGGGISRTHYQYTAYALSRNGKALGSPVRTEPLPDRVQNMTAIDGWLLFSTLTDTLAVPMSGD